MLQKKKILILFLNNGNFDIFSLLVYTVTSDAYKRL